MDLQNIQEIAHSYHKCKKNKFEAESLFHNN